MKRFAVLFCVCFMSFSWSFAQENLSRILITSLSGNVTVNQGEFQAKSAMPSNSMAPDYNDFLYIVQSPGSETSNIFVNGKILLYLKYNVRVFRLGSSVDQSIFVVKFLERDRNEIAYGAETVYAYGRQQLICDSVISLYDDGYVYKLRGKYYYSTYKDRINMGASRRITYPELRIFTATDRNLITISPDCDKLEEGVAYHYCEGIDDSKGHYYYLYRDEYMPHSVLIIDGKAVELFGVYTDQNFRLKFSYNGKHWMAVGDDYFWVDGQMKSVKGHLISDFLISDNGDYYYKASKKGGIEKSETVVMNGNIIRSNATVGLFCLNAQQQLKFHFMSRGQCYVYENGATNAMTEEFGSIFYKDDYIDGQKITVASSDGKNKLTFVNGVEGVEINGQRMTHSVPFQVIYDKQGNCFVWNAIEINSTGNVELVVYRYYTKK